WFNVTPSGTREVGLSDNYATTLWKRQAKQETVTLLQKTASEEYARSASIDFTCCEVAEYDFASIKGEVPDYGTTGLPLDLIIGIERPIEEADLEAMFHSATALRASSMLSLGKLVFLFEPPPGGGSVSYEIGGAALEAVTSESDMEDYNRTRLPAQDIAERIEATLQWDEGKHEAVFSRDETTLAVRSWGNEATLNGQPIADPVGAHIGDSMALMVPVRLIEQAFGQKLELWR
ncbi:MAG: Copper amine oxidase N-terminal domain, partial [Paenibacillus sp.]|nr:Copper amine oxidase N-terminal domain [Paenibacillus sp.]